MTVNSRAKGIAAEKTFARWLTDNGWPTKRRLAGNGQAGDLMIADAPDVVVDVKDRQQLRLHDWLVQLVDEADGREHMALVVKVAGVADPGRWLVVANTWPLGTRSAWWGYLLDKGGVAAILGWLEVQSATTGHMGAARGVVIHGEWSLMYGETWLAEVLPEWNREAVES